MGRKAAKATRKFAASGQLKKTIQARRKHQEIKRKAERRKGKKDGKGPEVNASTLEEDEVDEDVQSGNEDSLDLGIGKDEEVSLSGQEDLDEEDEDEDEDFDDNASFASVDELDEEGEAHMVELSKLAEKDPEFYKYLQENDRELLDFNPDNVNDVEMSGEEEEDGEEEGHVAPILTLPQLKLWSSALLKQRSLRALRKLLLAFRSAIYMHDDTQQLAWSIDSSSVYKKVVSTALRYTPIVLGHHCPITELPNGKIKGPTQTQKLRVLQKMILAYFHNISILLSQSSEVETLQLAVSESARLIPYISSSRKCVKSYLKTCLQLWSSADDSVRIAAFLAIRKLALVSDKAIVDLILKNLYLTLVRSCKSTTSHTLPLINMMKNSAAEVYTMNHALSYQHAFSYIRQLAIHLRTSVLSKTKEAYAQVYNWQFAHCVDFWSLVLAKGCNQSSNPQSELRALIYPLVQISLGAIKLIPSARSYPFHLHVAQSLIHLTSNTRTYVPLATFLLPIIVTTLSSSKPKASTLRPLDFEVVIRAPQSYLKTQVYDEGIIEEALFSLAEYLASVFDHSGVAFPEMTIPLVMTMRKALKNARGTSGKSKSVGLGKTLVERIEETSKWVEQKRKGISLSGGALDVTGGWEGKVEETPLGKYLKIQRKTREKRRELLEKARKGDQTMLEED